MVSAIRSWAGSGLAPVVQMVSGRVAHVVCAVSAHRSSCNLSAYSCSLCGLCNCCLPGACLDYIQECKTFTTQGPRQAAPHAQQSSDGLDHASAGSIFHTRAAMTRLYLQHDWHTNDHKKLWHTCTLACMLMVIPQQIPVRCVCVLQHCCTDRLLLSFVSTPSL